MQGKDKRKQKMINEDKQSAEEVECFDEKEMRPIEIKEKVENLKESLVLILLFTNSLAPRMTFLQTARSY